MTVILIPSLEPDEKLIHLVEEGKKADIGVFLIVDDGSSSACAPIFAALENMRCTVLHHEKNYGKGQALKTGISYVANHIPNADGIITADADGQHTLTDIVRIREALHKNPESLILGERALYEKSVPWKSRVGNRITAFVFFLSTGIHCVDTQTGLRGIPVSLFARAQAVEGVRYEYEMNMLTEFARAKIPFCYVPIHTIYLDDNRQSHFHPVRDSYLIYKKPLHFAAISLLCAGADVGLFALFSHLFAVVLFAKVGLATVLARLLSGALNYSLNRKFSFHSHAQIAGEMTRYLFLFFAQMAVSAALVSLLGLLAENHLTPLKLLVDTLLFFVSYQVQNRWVYRNRQSGKLPKNEREKP